MLRATDTSPRQWPVIQGNPSGGHHYHYLGWWKPEREISNDACWWSQWFKQWEQLWRLSVLAASSRCFRMNASAGVTLGLLTLLPPQAVYSVTWLSSCVFHQVSHLHLDVTIAIGERAVTAGVIWVHMNIGYTSRNPTPHCVISRHKNSRQIFSISPPI